MASPFPGMDPYLENPSRWGALHNEFISSLWLMLNRLLPPGYRAHIGERLSVVQPRHEKYPDVAVVETESKPKKTRKKGGTAVADPPRIVTVEPVEIRETYVEVRRPQSVAPVTVVELLSPSNKKKGHPTRVKYLKKQSGLLRSATSLLEIDLLLRGLHTLAVPRPKLQLPKNKGYAACLHRANQGLRFEVWEVTLRERLPRVYVPLRDPDPDVILDLQSVWDFCYDTAYVGDVDYHGIAKPPLEPDDAVWADALLRERGLRPAR